MKHVILIHGRGPKSPPKAWEKEWKQALELWIPTPPGQIHSHYYADWLHPESKAEHHNAESWKYLLNSYQRRVSYADLKQRFWDFDWQDNFFRLLHRLGSRLQLQVMKYFTPDFWHYLKGERHPQPGVELTKKLMNLLQNPQAEVMLLAHSMGSVITFEALHGNPKLDMNRIHLVTLGSPLAMSAVQAEVREYYQPNQLHGLSWSNLRAEDDLVAFHKVLAPYFPELPIFDYPIENLWVEVNPNRWKCLWKLNQHKALGYLAHPRLGNILRTFWYGRNP